MSTASQPARGALQRVRMRLAVAAFAIAALGITAADANAAPQPEPRIIGGQPADPGEYPFAVSLAGLNTDGHFCGGSLVSATQVLTAAHCVLDNPAGLVARIGGTSISGADAESMAVDAIDVHPKYDPSAEVSGYDVAILELSSPSSATPVMIAAPEGASDRAYWLNGRSATAVGWGEDETGALPDGLQEVALPVLADGAASSAYPELFDATTMVAAGNELGGVDSCFGDSGGPLVVPAGDGMRQVGVTSWGGGGCASPFKPGVYARVGATPIHDWIRSFVNPVALVADVNDDSVDDLVRVGRFSVEAAISNGRSFGPMGPVGSVEPGDIVRFGDADGDLDQDMWVFSDGDLRIFDREDGVFDAELHAQADVIPADARPTVADLDGDRRADVAYGRSSSEFGFHFVEAQAWEGDTLVVSGLGGFGAGAAGQTILASDVTADGIDDLIVFNQGVVGPGEDVWSTRLFSFEDFTFSDLFPRSEKLAGPGETPIAGDFNGDLVSDLGVVAEGTTRVVTAGVLGTDSVWLEGFGGIGEVLVGDVNGDLVDDLVNVTGNAADEVLAAPSTGSAFGPVAVWFDQPAPPAL